MLRAGEPAAPQPRAAELANEPSLVSAGDSLRARYQPSPGGYTLTAEQLATWERDGCLLVPDLLLPSETADLPFWSAEAEAWPPAQGGFGYTQAYERTMLGEVALCRVENYTPFHKGWARLVETRLLGVVSQLFDEPATLFKEKINIKAPAGRGYAPHYDGPSAASVGLAQTFITAQVAIDAQTVENGCLLVVRPRSACPAPEVVPPEEGGDPDGSARVGAIPPEVADSLDWEPVECAPGSVLFFHGMLPHRSAVNRSQRPRRTAYMLFNPAAEGEFHDEYYERMANLRAEYRARAAVERERAEVEAAVAAAERAMLAKAEPMTDPLAMPVAVAPHAAHMPLTVATGVAAGGAAGPRAITPDP
jgi:ectoine hydroxylase-related dioxygenase (phytanoyl-CoA dioxygenase family)